MENNLNTRVNNEGINQQLSTLFVKALKDPKFYEELVADTHKALMSAELSLRKEDLDKLNEQLHEMYDTTKFQTFCLVRELVFNIIDLYADRIVAPRPLPPPPPPIHWLHENIWPASINFAKEEIINEMEKKSKKV